MATVTIVTLGVDPPAEGVDNVTAQCEMDGIASAMDVYAGAALAVVYVCSGRDQSGPYRFYE